MKLDTADRTSWWLTRQDRALIESFQEDPEDFDEDGDDFDIGCYALMASKEDFNEQ